MSDEAQPGRVALVIEDDDQIAYLLQFILTKEGYTVKVARDGRAAQTLIEREPPPTVVTIDYMLPYLNGLELLAIIRARTDWNGVPVLMLTAKSQEKDIAHALESGAAGYVIKPFKPDELRARIRSVVRDRSS